MADAIFDHRASASDLGRGIRAWLGSGALQSASGAICAWKDGRTGELAFEYPEITGYALTWFAGREGELTDAERGAAERAAQWMVGRLEAGDRSARAGWDDGAVYTFDLGMIAAGLINWGRRGGDAAAEQLGLRTAAELAVYVRSDSGLLAIVPDGPRTTRPPEWSTAGVAHLVKCVQALLLADEHEAAHALVATAADEQLSDGRFRTGPADHRVMLHPHLYAVEGLWMYGMARQDEPALLRARQATQWAWEQQAASGGFPRFVDGEGGEAGPEQWDVTAQAVRAACMLGLDPDGLPAAVARLTALARSADPGRALVYQPDSEVEHLNAWVSMFGGQALEIVGGRTLRWQDLV